MPDVLSITTPIFLLIGLGYGAVRSGLFAKAALPALGSFVITFCIPALLFKSLSQRSIAEVANTSYLLAYAAGSLVTLAAGLLWARAQGQPRDAAAMTGMGMACANTAFIGYPVALQVVGPDATVALALTMLVENFLMIPLCLALADSAGARHETLAVAFGRAVLGLRRTPIVLGIYPILGQRYGRQAVNAACLLVSTVASFGTLTLVIWSLHAAWDVLLPP